MLGWDPRQPPEQLPSPAALLPLTVDAELGAVLAHAVAASSHLAHEGPGVLQCHRADGQGFVRPQ